MIQNRPCKRCARETRQEISSRVVANGVEHFGWWCLECRWWTESKLGGYWIPKDVLTANGVDLTVVRVAERLDEPRCAKCGARGAELHHWAPQAIFTTEEANRWPKDYLCKQCHDHWHRLVTPQLVGGARD